MKFVESHSNDSAYNLAFEEYIFKNLPLDNDEEYVYLWINDKSVIIGKNQNAYAEINKEYVDQNGVNVRRRITGGGAVYHDLGNLNFSFITKDNGSGKIDFKQYYIPIQNALRKLGIPAELSGRNDLTVEEKKCIGASQSLYKGRVLSNGCILFDVRMENLSSALNVRPEKLKAKGIQSVRARVTNLKPYLSDDMTTEEFKKVLLEEIFALKGEKPVEYVLSEEELKEVEKIKAERFGNDEWNYGRSQIGHYNNGIKFDIGWIEVNFSIEDQKLSNVKILGDFFGTNDVKELEDKLNGVKYDHSEIVNVLKNEDLFGYFGKIEADDIASLFTNLG